MDAGAGLLVEQRAGLTSSCAVLTRTTAAAVMQVLRLGPILVTQRHACLVVHTTHSTVPLLRPLHFPFC